MKRYGCISKIFVCAATISMSMFLLAGCQSKDATGSNNQATSTSAQNSNRPDPAQTKQMMQDNIKSLVSDGTITQAQADKIVETMSNRPRGNNQNNNGNGQQNNQQSNDQNSQKNTNQGSGQNRQRNNPLSKLVSDGTITQAQADAVMQKLRGNFGNRNTNQAPKNNSTTSTNQ
jgi:polyhydroxyalkanoate synthesis regulator phasin